MHYSIEDKALVWTKEQSIKLIREYKARPVLWDYDNANRSMIRSYSDRVKEWVSIGKALNLPVSSCRYKMTKLMSALRREKAKFLKALKSGKIYMSTWFAYKEMSFLLNRRRHKPKLSKDTKRALLEHQNNVQKYISQNCDISNDEDTISTQSEEHEEVVKLESISDEDSEIESGGETFAPLPGPSRNEGAPVKMFSVATSTDPMAFTEITAFTNFINSKMKKYSVKTITAVEEAIFDILLKADRNYYENYNNDT